MTKPTPSPAPASGAETTYCAQCVLNGSGRFPMRDGDCTNPRCVLYMRHLVARPSWLALPTPPSDAGTSERETEEWACVHCSRRYPSSAVPPRCLKCFRGDFYPVTQLATLDALAAEAHATAAPAAEGPREEPVRCPCCHDGGKPAPSSGTRYQYDCLQCGHDWTPAAALTSEVRALTEQREMLRGVVQDFALVERHSETRARGREDCYRMPFNGAGWFGTREEAVTDWLTSLAARLASPSPTGAP